MLVSGLLGNRIAVWSISHIHEVDVASSATRGRPFFFGLARARTPSYWMSQVSRRVFGPGRRERHHRRRQVYLRFRAQPETVPAPRASSSSKSAHSRGRPGTSRAGERYCPSAGSSQRRTTARTERSTTAGSRSREPLLAKPHNSLELTMPSAQTPGRMRPFHLISEQLERPLK